MEWKDGNCWYSDYSYNYCFNKQVFLIEIKLIFLKVVLKEFLNYSFSADELN